MTNAHEYLHHCNYMKHINNMLQYREICTMDVTLQNKNANKTEGLEFRVQ